MGRYTYERRKSIGEFLEDLFKKGELKTTIKKIDYGQIVEDGKKIGRVGIVEILYHIEKILNIIIKKR